MKAVAYYRSRPSEPEASAVAMRLQREAVASLIESDGMTLVAEFIEREGEGDDSYPAYKAAVRAAVALKEDSNTLDVALIFAGHAGIGTGQPFAEPDVEGSRGLLNWRIVTSLVEPASEIPLPGGHPVPLCLYADRRPRQAETNIYLCNAGPAPLIDVKVAIDNIDMAHYCSAERGAVWAQPDHTQEKLLPIVPASAGVHVNTLDHVFWDSVNRYRISFTDAAGQHHALVADDMQIVTSNPAGDPGAVWVCFRPITE